MPKIRFRDPAEEGHLTEKSDAERLERILHHLRILLIPSPPGSDPGRMGRWPEKWPQEARESLEVLKREAWAADEHGHRWFQILAAPGFVREECGVGGCATKRQRPSEATDWELLCGLCDRTLGTKPAGPCAGCLDPP